MAWGDNSKGPWGKGGSSSGKSGSNNGSKGETQSRPKKGNIGSKNSDDGFKSGSPFSGGSGAGEKVIDIDSFFKGGGGGDFQINTKIVIALLLVAILGWAATGFYKVDASEVGVVLRFGKYERTEPEGLRYHIPFPIEKVYIVQTTKINSIQIGYRSSQNDNIRIRDYFKNRATTSSGNEIKLPAESLMITGDTNIADVNFAVQWRIKEAKNYLFNISNPEETIKAVAESAMRETIGKSKFAEAMTTKRAAIENEVQNIVQTVLDSYEAGIDIYAVNLNDVQNPAPVMPAFLDVETAKQDRETAINKAKAYENEIIPNARGQAQKLIQEAEAYREQVISIAEGEAKRFADILTEYSKAKDVTKKRIYIETMQEVLRESDKIVLGEGAGGNVLPYLPLKDMNKK
jgi:membrane protease subunit HflK